MPPITRVRPHLSPQAIKTKLQETVGFGRVQKWLVIYNAAVDPRPAAEIAQHTGLAVQTVHNLVSQYNRLGPAALSGPGKGGRRRSYLSREEEAHFLASFETSALRGQVATALEIQLALERRLGHPIHRSMVYKMLQRHGWRKLAPRPRHVDSDPERQEAFKKTSPPPRPPRLPRGRRGKPGRC